MIEVDHTLLSDDALDNLIVDVITRQATEYGEYDIAIQTKKEQLKRKLLSGDAVIVFSATEEVCDIIRQEDFKAFKLTQKSV